MSFSAYPPYFFPTSKGYLRWLNIYISLPVPFIHELSIIAHILFFFLFCHNTHLISIIIVLNLVYCITR